MAREIEVGRGGDWPKCERCGFQFNPHRTDAYIVVGKTVCACCANSATWALDLIEILIEHVEKLERGNHLLDVRCAKLDEYNGKS